jgi:hypothetical protein
MKKFTLALVVAATLLNLLASGMSLIQKHYFQAFNSFTVALMFGFMWVFEVNDQKN